MPPRSNRVIRLSLDNFCSASPRRPARSYPCPRIRFFKRRMLDGGISKTQPGQCRSFLI
ncbi:hypothetical protein X989_5005 [Burkholderia pseudomallei MSHR4378]|nr:hypothetical protein X989_5005 [Burkholderia pseudomallei MSHR4378]